MSPTRASAARLRASASRTGDLGEQLHVLERGQGRHEIEELEYEPHPVTAIRGQLISRERRDVRPGNDDRAVRRFLDPADHVQQRGLARPRRPKDHDELARRDVERHVPQRIDRDRARAVPLRAAAHRDRRFARTRSLLSGCGELRRAVAAVSQHTHRASICPAAPSAGSRLLHPLDPTRRQARQGPRTPVPRRTGPRDAASRTSSAPAGQDIYAPGGVDLHHEMRSYRLAAGSGPFPLPR